MEDLQPPAATKRKLPFKRTIRRQSTETAEDGGLSLFSRSGEFFEEQKRLAEEKAEREKAKAEKAAKDAKAKQERREQAARETQQARKAELDKILNGPHGSAKRSRSLLSDDGNVVKDGDDDGDDDVFNYRPPKKHISPSAPRTPSSSSFVNSSRGSRERLTRSQSRIGGVSVFALDDDDDDDPVAPMSPSKLTPSKRPSKKRHTVETPLDMDSKEIIDLDDDSDTQADAINGNKEDGVDDISEYYIKLAMERKRKAEEERKAREKSGANEAGAEDGPVIDILIHSQVQGVHTLMFKRRLCQSLSVVYEAWVEQQLVRHCEVTRPMLETMFFTWKGNKVYRHTTLQTLGIKPESNGQLYPSWKDEQEGYHGRDKVYFEAWTQELYDAYLVEKEKQRLRDLGELLDEEPGQTQSEEQPQDSQGVKKIRVHFKAKNQPPKNATVRSNTTTAMLIEVYRKLAKIPEDKTIELHWDGEVLDQDTTVEEADIEDMDSLEVHIK
ncbi:hypothetical protein GGR54DRAFT_525243 [Hypoxylon sp. NC1633]|nr:hypothetical protein GGR54DRAFT_525243 [Hypoxylon sp. NC1633]